LTRSRLILIASLFSLSLSSAFAQSTPSETLAADPVFQSNCAKCHGKDADGRFMAGPSLISKKASALSADETHNMILNGKGRMPKFGDKLSADQIDKLVAEIQAAKK
jgi:cytochrome c551